MLLCSRNYPQVLGKGKSQEEGLDNFQAQPNYYVIPGIITNGIMTNGGPAMFLSRSAAVPPLLKLFGEEKLPKLNFNLRAEQRKAQSLLLRRNSTQNVAKEKLWIWLNEGAIRPDIEVIVKSTISRNLSGTILNEEYTLDNLKEASDILLPTMNSISKFLVITQINNDPSISSFFRLISSRSSTDNVTDPPKTNNSCLMTVNRLFNTIKMKFNKTDRMNSLLVMLMGAVFVAATSWRLVTRISV